MTPADLNQCQAERPNKSWSAFGLGPAQTTKLVCGWCKGSGKDYSEWLGRWVHCGSCGGNGASKQ